MTFIERRPKDWRGGASGTMVGFWRTIQAGARYMSLMVLDK